MPTFEDFLRFGKVGAIALGMSQDEVRSVLGPPPDVSISKRPEIWRYGACEIAFYWDADAKATRLCSIIYYFRPQPIGLPPTHPSLRFEGWSPNPETTITEMYSYLDQASLAVVNGLDEAGPTRQLILQSSARITFEFGECYCASIALQSEIKTKQLSISIPIDQYRAIQTEAKSRGLSASALCSEWIMQRSQHSLVRKS